MKRHAPATARNRQPILDVLHQQLDQARLEQQAGLVGRSLDRGAQVGFVHRSQQVQPGLEKAGERTMG